MAETLTGQSMNVPHCIFEAGRETTRFGEVPLYTEGLYDLGQDVYAWMVPNGAWGESNAGLVVGDGASLLIDTLWDHDYTAEMLSAMKPYTDKAPIKTLFNTHADGDHFWGNYLLKDIDILASEDTLKDMDHHKPQQMKLFNLVGRMFSMLPWKQYRQAGHWIQSMCKPYNFNGVIHTPAKRSFKGKTQLDIGGRAVEFIEVGPAHRPGDALAYIPDAKILFTADILFIGGTPVIWQGPVENWIKAIDLILEMDVQHYVPGHGSITDKTGVQLVKDYWIYISTEARKRYDVGIDAAKAAEEIVLSDGFSQKPFAHWDSPERIMTNCYTLYRNFSGNSKAMKPIQIIAMMTKQAALANKLPYATPKVMRYTL